MTDPAASRRPIAARSFNWVRRLAIRLTEQGITPNQISQASVGFAALAFVLFWAVPLAAPVLAFVALLLGAASVQGRLMCNLLDGMVALEGGKSAPTGPFWNEAPDRAADALILTGLGFAACLPGAGLVAALLAITTAYLRELGRAEGSPPDFGGPLAKPQRMALVTGAAILAALSHIFATADLALFILQAAVWLLVLGTALTIALRTRRLLTFLTLRDPIVPIDRD